MQLMDHELLNKVIQVAEVAGDAIKEIYNQYTYTAEEKKDGSPITTADQKAHDIICEALVKFPDSFPVLSEESTAHVMGDQRLAWNTYWLVDPLDGTKEFIKRNGEFTVNIALIHQGQPILGVVYAPMFNLLYYAAKGQGAYKKVESSIQKLPIKQTREANSVSVVMSRSHASKETLAFIEEIEAKGKVVEALSKGSSLKLCMVAEGAADYYPRFAPTMEWDTAAAQCVVEESGHEVLSYEDQQPLRYNKPELTNPWFLVK